jgi:peptide deformylase
MLLIVPPEQIPVAQDCPIDDLMRLYKTCLEMVDLCEKEKGAGLSAVQVGIPWHLYVLKDGQKYRFFVNCRYNAASTDRVLSIEGCLSLRDKKGRLLSYRLARYKEVKILGHELVEGSEKPELVSVDSVQTGFIGIVHQHEIDHGYGVLIRDFGQPIDIRQ